MILVFVKYERVDAVNEGCRRRFGLARDTLAIYSSPIFNTLGPAIGRVHVVLVVSSIPVKRLIPYFAPLPLLAIRTASQRCHTPRCP